MSLLTLVGMGGIGLLLINFNTAVQTIRCLESILNSSLMPDSILLLDNASEIKDLKEQFQIKIWLLYKDKLIGPSAQILVMRYSFIVILQV